MKLDDLLDKEENDFNNLSKGQVISLETLTKDKEMITDIQTELSEIGVLSATDIDGIFGPETAAALTLFCDAVDLNNMSTHFFGPTFATKLINFRGPIKTNQTSSLTTAPNPTDALAKALKLTLKFEGGFVNNPADPGGATNFGVTQTTYNRFRIGQRKSVQSVSNITSAEVEQIYSEMYWKLSHADLAVLPLAVVIFDTAVLFGVGGAIKFLQEAIGVTADGGFGANTKSALDQHNNKATAFKMIEIRVNAHNRRVAAKPTQKIFLKGWLSRCTQLKDFITPL
jgi:peptidoglycan hydrolase-like protein with peptidoglycan-binding domain